MLKNVLYTIFLFIIQVISAYDVYGLDVSKGPINLSIGNIHIHTGGYWSIIDNTISALVGDLKVERGGGFFISTFNELIGLQVLLLGLLNSIENDGIIAFNSLKTLIPPIYNLIGLTFRNTGEVYLAADGTLPPFIGLTAPTWTNNGLVVIYLNKRSTTLVNLGAVLSRVENDGTICFNNVVYQQLTSIQGNGCIVANRDSTIYITNALLPIPKEQTFFLADHKSSIVVEPLSIPARFTVKGFGWGNKIGLSIPLLKIPILGKRAVDYNPFTGILTLRGLGLGLLSQEFDIGRGYDKRRFQVVTDNGAGIPLMLWGSVEYNGPIPNPHRPAICMCKDPPEPPTTGESLTSLPAPLTTVTSVLVTSPTIETPSVTDIPVSRDLSSTDDETTGNGGQTSPTDGGNGGQTSPTDGGNGGEPTDGGNGGEPTDGGNGGQTSPTDGGNGGEPTDGG
ncbi:Cell wall protein IFF6, partial [Candida parapsilosis]